MESFKHIRTLKEHFEIHGINYFDKESYFFKQWQNTLISNDYKDKIVFFDALIKRDSYLLFATVMKLTRNFFKILKDLEGVPSNEYFISFLVRDVAFKSPIVNKFGFAFHLRDLLRFYRTKFLIEQKKDFFVKNISNKENNYDTRRTNV